MKSERCSVCHLGAGVDFYMEGGGVVIMFCGSCCSINNNKCLLWLW